MLRLPKSILNKLVCVYCGGYLSCSPIMITKSGEQICGECFEKEPKEKMIEYTRQIGLEAVGEVLIFPCRYNLQGCNHTFQWNCAKEHERNCFYNDNTLPADEIVFQNNSYPREVANFSNEHVFELEDLKMKNGFENISENQRNQNEISKFRMELNIESNNRNVLTSSPIRPFTPSNPASLKVEPLVSMDENADLNYSYAKTLLCTKEHIYSEIPRYSRKCNQCKCTMYDEIHHCLFGHPTCKNCKGILCKLCSQIITGDSHSPCKNFARGCTTLFLTEGIRKHEIDCEYNDFHCPINKCGFQGIVSNLIPHCKQEHQNEIILSKTVTTKLKGQDKNLYFCYYGKLFVFRYFVFDDYVDLVVEYVGAHDIASKYRYRTTVHTDLFYEPKTKHSKCLGWNEAALDTAIRYRIKHENLESHLNYHAEITILQ